MISSSNENGLHIFDVFQVDRELPKYKKSEKEKSETENFFINSSTMGENIIARNHRRRLVFSGLDENGLPIISWDPIKRPWYINLISRILSWFGIKWLSKVYEPTPPMTVSQFFSSVKNSAEELKIIEGRAQGYQQAIKKAQQNGQTALCEQLVAGLHAYRMETQMLVLGLTKSIKEEDIVKFYKLSDKGLRLDWIKNYTRTIPDNITSLKIRADELELFDNYVILHYDPEAKSYAETQKEKEARKDPILFGVIKDRKILYFIGDWVDELCDLTLDQIADKLGKEVIQEIQDVSPGS